jgi:hypothetical protein
MSTGKVPWPQIGKFALFGGTGMAVGLGVCGLTMVDSALERKYSDKDPLEILKQYDMELFDTFLKLTPMREKDPRTFATMQKSLVRLLTLELHFDRVASKRTDWPRVASSYVYDVERACETLARLGSKDELDRIVKVAKDIAHNVDLSWSDKYLHPDP